MHRIVAGGTGFIGRHIIRAWLAQGIKVTVIGRNQHKIKQVFGDSVTALTWSQLQCLTPQQLKQTQCILNLSGANLSDERWSESRKRKILGSRIKTTEKLLRLISPLLDHAPRLLNASAVGVYGFKKGNPEHLPISCDEDTPLNFDAYPDFPTQVARRWEKTTFAAQAHGVPVNHLRFGVVLGARGGMVSKLLSIYKLGLGGKLGKGCQPLSWIHIEDLVSAIEFIIEHPSMLNAVNLVAPECVTQSEFAKTLAKTLKRPCVLPLPAWIIKLIYGDMGKYLLLKGQNVYPKRLISADFEFKYPTLETALENILLRD